MNKTKRLISTIGLGLCGALLGYTTYGQPSVSVGVSVSLPAVEIRAESDFYEPLTPHGEWVVIGSYGRCWRPGHVAREWRPYCNGYWQRTEAGWYWVSDEPWAWATYHYGRWDFTDQYGWYWVPQTQWAPAWVSWHSGGGYVGWAPLQPAVRISEGGFVGFNVSLISPRAFVFVEQRRFLEPVSPTTVVVNNTTIINKTTTITNTKIVNNTVINEGPATTVIEKASGRKVQAVQVQELRHKTEAAVVARQQTPTATSEKKVQTPVRSEAKPVETKAPVDTQRRAKESEAAAQEQSQKNAKALETKTQVESQRQTSEAAAKAQEAARSKAKESERLAQLESQQRANEASAKAQETARSKAKESERLAQLESQQRGKELDKKTQAEAEKKANGQPELRPKNEPIVSERGGAKPAAKPQQKKGEGKPSSPENPPAPPKSSP